jgi:hypothetical protein
MTRCAALFACAALAAAAGKPDPSDVLVRAIAKVRENARRVPNFTCVETVTRDYYVALAPIERSCDVVLAGRAHPTLDRTLRLASTDRLRLEVTMSNRGETHAWAGANRFDDSRIDSVVRDGPIGTGAFGALLSAVFDQDVKKFNFEREVVVDGRARMEFAYDVALADSHYRMKIYEGWTNVSYHGRFAVDTATDDVVWLEVQTGPLPPASMMCQTTTNLDFGVVSIGAVPFRLPTATRQQFVETNAGEVENRIDFSACREFRGESSITFGADAPPAAGGSHSGAPPPRPAPVPPKLPFELELLTPIDTDTAAAGDPFSARLATALRSSSARQVAPKGARVEGRLVRVQMVHRAKPEVVVVFRPEIVETTAGVRIPLFAVQEVARNLKKGTVIVLPRAWETASGLFRFPGEHVVVPKGLVSHWRTVAPPQKP